MQSALAFAAFLAFAGGANAIDLRGSHRAGSLGAAGMRPDLVAQSLSAVEDEWRTQAAGFVKCQLGNATLTSDCSNSAESFAHSCALVAKSMVAGSSGDGSVVTEYMGFVCNSTALSGWKQDGCYSFARAIETAMTDDKYNNRENLNITRLCAGFWSEFSAGEEKREEKERAEREAEEKRLAEKAAEEAKQAAEEAKRVEEERKKKDEAERAEEARKQAEEAKTKAEEAAKALEEKKAEAAKMAEEAEQRKADAKKAAEEHARLTNVTNGSQVNTTKPKPVQGNATDANATTANATEAKTNKTEK